MRRTGPVSLAFFYFTTFTVLGVYLPYFNLYAESLGFDGLRIGILAAAIPVGKVMFGPLWALWADHIGRRKEIAVFAVAAASATFAFLFGLEAFLPMCAVLYVYSAFLSPQLPVVEATTLELAQRNGWQYGRIRLWGSLGFIAAALLLGPVFDVISIRYVLHFTLAALILNLVATACIPNVPPEKSAGRQGLTSTARPPSVLLFLTCGLLMQASHGGYFTFFSIVLEDAGFQRGAIGALWTLGVIAEIVTMMGAAWLLRRFGVAAVMTGCLALAGLRWGLYAQSTWLPVLLFGQLLHAFTFGAFHVAAITGTFRLFPERLRSSGQSLFSGFTYGAGNALGFFGAGALFDWVGPRWMFAASSALALAASLLSLVLWREAGLREPSTVDASAVSGGGGIE